MRGRTFIFGLHVINGTVALDVSIKARYHRVDLGEIARYSAKFGVNFANIQGNIRRFGRSTDKYWAPGRAVTTALTLYKA